MIIQRIAGDRHSFDQRVRIALHQDPIFESAGLALISIAQKIGGLVGVSGNKAPLHSGWEAGASTSSKPAGLHLIDDRGLLHRKCFLESPVAASFPILIDIRLIGFIYVCE